MAIEIISYFPRGYLQLIKRLKRKSGKYGGGRKGGSLRLRAEKIKEKGDAPTVGRGGGGLVVNLKKYGIKNFRGSRGEGAGLSGNNGRVLAGGWVP